MVQYDISVQWAWLTSTAIEWWQKFLNILEEKFKAIWTRSYHEEQMRKYVVPDWTDLNWFNYAVMKSCPFLFSLLFFFFAFDIPLCFMLSNGFPSDLSVIYGSQ